MIKKFILPAIPPLLGVFAIWWISYSLAHLPYTPHHHRPITYLKR
jgi:hypothetical protein